MKKQNRRKNKFLAGMVGLTVLAMAVTACGRTGVDVTASEEVESSVEVTESVELSTEGMETELEIEVEVESEGKSETEESKPETEKPETAGGAPLHTTADGGNPPAPATVKAHAMHGGCPGQRLRRLGGDTAEDGAAGGHTEIADNAATPGFSGFAPSRLGQWPCQIKLVPTNAPYFAGAKLLIAADCTAYAYARMHEDFMRGKITLIGCPKLDAVDYTAKLTEIIRENDIRSLTVVRMEVPCCGGLEAAAKTALRASGKFIPWQVVTVSVDGHLID